MKHKKSPAATGQTYTSNDTNGTTPIVPESRQSDNSVNMALALALAAAGRAMMRGESYGS